MGPREILLGGVVPGCIAGIVMLLVWWRVRRAEKPGVAARAIVPIAFFLAYLPADWAINSWPKPWPIDSTLRFPHTAAILAVLGIIDAIAAQRPAVTLARRACLSAGAAWVVFSGLHPSTLGARDLAFWIAGSALLLALVAGVVDRAAARVPGWASGAALASTAAAAGPVMLWSHTATFAQQSGAIVAALAASIVVSIVIRRCSVSPGGVSFAVGMLGLLVVGAWLFGSRRPWAASHALAILAPCGMAAALWPSLRQRSPAARGFASILGTVAMAVAAVVVAVFTKPQSMY